MSTNGLLVLGYGNPGREDDGLGPAAAGALQECAPPGVAVQVNYQLNIEDAATITDHAAVLFVDASKTSRAPFNHRRISPASAITFTSHALGPEAVLALCEEHFGPPPPSWLLEIRGYAFEPVEGFTPTAQENLEKAVSFLRRWIRGWKEGTNHGNP